MAIETKPESGFSVEVVVTGAGEKGGTKSADGRSNPRYRVSRKNYYLSNGPKHPTAHQCIRCNEVLGARQTILYVSDYGSFSVEQSQAFNVPVRMGVFCAIAALEDGETMDVGETEEVA